MTYFQAVDKIFSHIKKQNLPLKHWAEINGFSYATLHKLKHTTAPIYPLKVAELLSLIEDEKYVSTKEVVFVKALEIS